MVTERGAVMAKRWFPAGALALALAAPGGGGENAPPPADMAVWLVEWQAEAGHRELNYADAPFSAINWFAAHFDEKDALVPPAALEELRRDVARASGAPAAYLTVVNDRPGRLKDPELVARLLADAPRRAAHAQALIAMATDGGYAGLELDYEAIAEETWPTFVAWVGGLREPAAAAGLRLRVILEPKAKYWRLPLPEGPEYVLMAYNLHGGHSGPGPKANPAFLGRMAALCANAGVWPRLALATGGFAWAPGEKAKGLTQEAAENLARRERVVAARDPESQALYFRFPLGAPPERLTEAWYADGETLAFWVRTARELGFRRFALWRLGGNRPDALRQFIKAVGEGEEQGQGTRD